ncbi:MAG: TRAP transporter small permease [Lachnospiraceae bacterium]|nr:TRAP transporter small permease [Lachnospiraceae bacterium]
MSKIYGYFVKAEEFLACLMLAGIVGLMFLSAVLRKAGLPLNWAGDTSLLLFTWACFFGADLAIREKSMVNVDMLLTKFPVKVQKGIRIACQIATMALLFSFIYFGIPLCIESVERKFSNMNLSYSWASASVPAGSFLLLITSGINLVKMFKSEDGTYGKQGGNDVC